MQTKITIRNEAQTCYIDIEGTIGVPEENQFEDASSRVATFEAFRREVKRITEVAAKSVVVNIRSTGGDVNDALLIYDALRDLDAHITTRCYGYTASAATIIAQAADEGCREISSNALYLIHNSTCSIDGNSASLDARAELLRKTDEQLANLYALHSGGEAEKYAALMAENGGEGRWLTAEETIEAGLADAIIEYDDYSAEAAEQAESEQEGHEQQPEKAKKALPADKSARKAAKATRTSAAAESTWSSIIRFLLDRLAERIDEWIEQIRLKREKKKKEKEEKRLLEEQLKQTESGTEQERDSADEESTTEQDNDPTAAGQPTTEATLPKASANASSILFSERQRSVKATKLSATEDPSMTRSAAYANEQAYADDVKAFGR